MNEKVMQGRLLKHDGDATFSHDGKTFGLNEVQPGDYWYWTVSKTWMAKTPNGLMTNLAGHQITEHEDGTITASPSIFVNRDQPVSWHGFLERGVWREC